MATRKVYGNLQSALIPVQLDTRPARPEDLTQAAIRQALGGAYKTGIAARYTPGMKTRPWIKDRFESLVVQGRPGV